MAELRRKVGLYLSFAEEEVFWGVDLPEEEGSKPSAPTTAATDTPWCHHCCRDSDHTKGGSKLCWVGHSITPILTCDSHRGSPQAERCTASKEKSLLTHQDHSHQPPPKTPGFISTKVSLPAKALALVRPPTLPCGFAGVAACLRTLNLWR